MTALAASTPMTDDCVLRRCLEQSLTLRREDPAQVAEIRTRASKITTSYPVALLDVELRDGRTVGVFLKDFGRSRLPKPGRPPERELRVYRELLGAARLGTPQYLGSVWTEERRWLLLELVDAPELKRFDFDAWLKGATRLGRLHGHFARQAGVLARCTFLERHDEAFFEARAERARRALAAYPPSFSARLERVLAGHAAVARRLARQPTTLVHGSFRPRNALFDAARGRVAIIDWELAGVGSGLYDLGFFAEGFRSPELDSLLRAYAEGAAAEGLIVRDDEQTRALIDRFRLQKELKSLGDAQDLEFREATVDKILRLAEQVREGMRA